jgi:hypothetical protein
MMDEEYKYMKGIILDQARQLTKLEQQLRELLLYQQRHRDALHYIVINNKCKTLEEAQFAARQALGVEDE